MLELKRLSKIQMGNDIEASTVKYLLELRICLLRSLCVLAVIFLLLLPFSNELYQILAIPLLKQMSSGSTLIATSLTTPLMAPIKWVLSMTFFMTIPFFFYQIWLFVSPALYPNERHL